MTDDQALNSVVIPRITLNSIDSKNFSFVLHWRKFPVRLGFAMTVNKSQGKTFDKISLIYIKINQSLGMVNFMFHFQDAALNMASKYKSSVLKMML